MKKLMMATTAMTLIAGGAFAQDVKIGVVLGFTGPLESITPAMAAGAELAMAVQEHLVSKGIPSNRVYAATFGSSRPKGSKEQSRRVEIVILAPGN